MLPAHRKTQVFFGSPFSPCKKGGPNPTDEAGEGAPSPGWCHCLPPPPQVGDKYQCEPSSCLAGARGCCLLCHMPLATRALLVKIDSISFLPNCLTESLGLCDIFVASCRSLASRSFSPSRDTTAASQPSFPSCDK